MLSSQDSIEKMNEAFKGDKGRRDQLASDLKYYDHRIAFAPPEYVSLWMMRRAKALAEYEELIGGAD